jgi:hypothetical protein
VLARSNDLVTIKIFVELFFVEHVSVEPVIDHGTNMNINGDIINVIVKNYQIGLRVINHENNAHVNIIEMSIP